MGQKSVLIADGNRKAEKKNRQSLIALTVSVPQKEEDGNFTVYVYAIVRQSDGGLINGQGVTFHLDNLKGFVEETGDGENGRADHTFFIPASRAGESVAITAYTQIGNKRHEATKIVSLPKEKEKPPTKKETGQDFFETLKKYKEGDKK